MGLRHIAFYSDNVCVHIFICNNVIRTRELSPQIQSTQQLPTPASIKDPRFQGGSETVKSAPGDTEAEVLGVRKAMHPCHCQEHSGGEENRLIQNSERKKTSVEIAGKFTCSANVRLDVCRCTETRRSPGGPQPWNRGGGLWSREGLSATSTRNFTSHQIN